MHRRRFMTATLAAAGAASIPRGAFAQTNPAAPGVPAASVNTPFVIPPAAPGGTRARPLRLDPEIAELQRRTFDWFVHVTDRRTGLTLDRWPTPSFASIAAVGFALTCWPIGVSRGWMTRAEARERTLTTLRFFEALPQGPQESGVGGHKGFFYHFLDMETGHRFARCELSTVDTSLLVAGMLFAARFFDRAHADEVEIRRLAQLIYERIEWDWILPRANRISMGWHPETGFITSDWSIYNEGMLLLLLAIGSPTHPVSPNAWHEWCWVYDQSWTDEWGPEHLHFAPLFGHQYSHLWTDFRGIQDAWLRGKSGWLGLRYDYFENSRRAVYAQQKYAIDNVGGWAGYSADVWGLTACDGPGDFTQNALGRDRDFFSYSARGPGDRDDGTIAPTAAASSLPFAPELVVPCVKAMKDRYGAAIYSEWGFRDSFNPTLTEHAEPLQHGSIVPGVGWVDGDYLGIDQGPIIIMAENHRSDFVWRLMRGEPNLRRGLALSGFSGGWLDRA